MKKIATRDLILIGLFSAIVIIQTYTPLGYIKLALVDFTLIHITVIIAACLLGAKKGAIVGGVWGITSLILALSSPGILNPIFYNPLVSVFPRILVGFLAGLTFDILNKKQHKPIPESIAALIGTLTNTILVLTFMYIFGRQIILDANIVPQVAAGSDPALVFIFSLIGTNTLFEIVSAMVIVPLVTIPLKKLK